MEYAGFRVGDYARGLEDGWLGRIVEFEADGMARMIGVDELAQPVGGLSREEALSPDDIRWYAAADLVPA